MARAGEALRDASVDTIYLVHGTFTGNDALGLLRMLAGVVPAASSALRRAAKSMVDRVFGDVGNYTAEYARVFEQSLAGSRYGTVRVNLFHWSSENHHLGRAEAAVRLLAELAQARPVPGKRILLWGHSHAGNVFALASNLLAGDGDTIKQFFDATRAAYCRPMTGYVDVALWREVAELLERPLPLLANNPLDVVTFGTPIRYGWDLGGCGRLLHFVNHRPGPDVPRYRTAFPPRPDDLVQALAGDYIHQLGIAGSDVPPPALLWRSWRANTRLAQLVEADLPGDLTTRLEAGMRVPQAGATMLVDYGVAQESIAQHMAGHAVYTRLDHLLFHVEQVVEKLYSGK